MDIPLLVREYYFAVAQSLGVNMSTKQWFIFGTLFYAAVFALVVAANWLLTPAQLMEGCIWLIYAIIIGVVISSVLTIRALTGKK